MFAFLVRIERPSYFCPSPGPNRVPDFKRSGTRSDSRHFRPWHRRNGENTLDINHVVSSELFINNLLTYQLNICLIFWDFTLKETYRKSQVKL